MIPTGDIHPACALCRGACCECVLQKPGKTDDLAWWDARGEATPFGYMLLTRCRHLTFTGKCAIYEERPFACEVFLPGCAECREVVKRRRPARAAEILKLVG